jgi:hypothetical protein
MSHAGALGLVTVGLLLPLSVFAQQDAPYAVLELRVRPGSEPLLPAAVSLDLADLAAALGVPLEHSEPLCLMEEKDGQLTRLPSQFEPGPGFDWQTHARGTLALSLPSSATGDQRVRVYVGSTRPRIAEALPTSDLKVDATGGRVVVESRYYRLTHDPKLQGGLPSCFEFKATGKTFEAFTWNDRLYDATLMGFYPRNTRTPRVEVAAEGPVRTVVRVHLEFVKDRDVLAPSRPTAVYDFVYLPNSPLIACNAQLRQEQGFTWREAHLAEINFKGTDFSRYLTSAVSTPTAFKADKKKYYGSWGALVEGNSVLGLVADNVSIYDGRGDYGTYVQGAWESMTGTEHKYSAVLYVSGEADAAAQLQTMAKNVVPVSAAIVGTSTLESRLASLRTKIKSVADARRRGSWAWALSLLERESRRPGQLATTEQVVEAMAEAMAKADADPFALLQPLLGTESRFTPVENGSVGLGFLQSAGRAPRLVSLFDFGHEREHLLADAGPLFRLDLSAGAEQLRSVTAEDAWKETRLEPGPTTEPGKASCLLRWRTPADSSLGEIEVQVPITLEGRRITWSIAVRPHSDTLGLRTVTFPSLALQRLRSGQDYAFVPRGSGVLTANPTQRMASFSQLWPSISCTMQFGGYYDSLSGVYFAAQDAEATIKYLRFLRLDNGIGCEIATPAPNTGVPKNDFVSFPCVTEIFEGDWFDAAQKYKSWARKEAGWWPLQNEPGQTDLKGLPRPTPRWMSDMPLWVDVRVGPKEAVEPLLRLREYLGVPFGIHWHNWHQIPFDTDYPHYFPAKEGFAEALNRLQEGGVRVFPYINGRLWDSESDDFKTVALPGATKNEKGDYYIEIYGSKRKLVPMCPTNKVWQDTIKEVEVRLGGPEFHADGIYLDQIAAAGPVQCFDATHSHPLGGGNWWTKGGYWPLMGDLISRLPAETAVTTECNAEAYARWFDGYLNWHFQEQDQIPLFAAVYGGRIQCFGRAYGGNDRVGFVMKGAQQLVYGEQLGWFGARLILDDPTVLGPFFRRLARMRYALAPYLGRGEMARPPVIEGKVPDITASWTGFSGAHPVTDSALQRSAWKSSDGRLAVVLVNALDRPLQATLKIDGTRYGFAAGSTLSVTPRTEEGTSAALTKACLFELPVELPAYGAVAYEIAPATH